MSSSVTTGSPAADDAPAPPTGGRLTPRSIAIWGLVAAVGAVCWGVLAIARGETISAL